MQKVICPSCESDFVSALVRTYQSYDVRGITPPSKQAPSSRTLVLEGKPEYIESGLDEEFKCRNCGHCWDVPEDLRVFRRYTSAPLENCNI